MMDKERRNNLRRVINQCRKILEEDIEKRLAYFGIMADGTFLDLARLEHLSAEEIEIRKKIESAIEKEQVGGLDKKQAIQRYIRHTSFTFLNRIAALRAMEVRNLIKETIIQRSEYGGRSLREREIAENNPSLSPYDVLKTALIQAFKEVSEEIKVLFDVNSEYSIIFPNERACRDVIKLLTEDVTESDWKEDDIIGWIYQYYNDEARREYRKSKRKPNPDDIPVINQFYTPHWIVKALVDNTLGRLWIQMHPDSKLKEFCTYLMPLKNEGKREAKKVREIKVLDPACGSGHFLIYAFDVLYRMYLEEEPNTPIPEIVQSILENNLYGIDIDLFSTQLTALSLYLKAKTYDPSVKIRRMNIVCADVRISDGKKRSEFLERFRDDPDLQEIFAKLFEDLGYTFEIGSLLKVREPFERLFRERKKGPKQARFVLLGQTQLSEKGIAGQTKFVVESSETSKTNSVLIIPKERTIEEMIEELREFEKEAIETQDMGRLLFATEAEKSVGLLALLSEKYDVVLMNPPYGDMPERTKEYLKRYYPKTHFDYYAAFIEQAIDLAQDEGYVGAITGRTFMFLKSYQWVREVLLKQRAVPQVVLDLGFGVLDVAMARWAAFTITKNLNKKERNGQEIIFVRLTQYIGEVGKKNAWEVVLNAVKEGKKSEILYKTTLQELSKVPGMPYTYWSTSKFREFFLNYPPLDRDIAKKPNFPKFSSVTVGLTTRNDAQFLRYFFEVPSKEIGKKWMPRAGGGSEFYTDIGWVVYWEGNGKVIKEYGATLNGERFYFKEGICWPKIVSSIRINMYLLPKGCIFSNTAYALFPVKNEYKLKICACGNSSLFAYLFLLLDPTAHGRYTGYIACLPIATGIFTSQKLEFLAQEAYDLLKEWDTGNEVSTIFIKPWLLQLFHNFNPSEKPITNHPLASQFKWSNWQSAQEIRSVNGSEKSSLKELAELCVKRQQMLNKRVEDIQKEIDEEVYRIYGITDEDRALIERELRLQQSLSLQEETEEKESEEVEEISKGLISVNEHIERLISFYIKKALESDEDGIVPLDEMFSDNLFSKIREFIAQDFGKERVDKIELEASEILGKSLKRWVEEDYFDFHVSLYRRRPIFWQLTSSRLGKSKLPGVFSCFLYYHKLDRDTIPKILAFYLNPIKERLYREKERVFKELEKARTSGDRKRINELSKAYEESLRKVDEIESMEKALITLHNPRKDKTQLKPNAKWVEKAIAEVRDNGWNPIIDYGVRVNIEPLKELKILHPAADRVK
ncbi:MAG: BREX-1 system adenine-specific DNA-methyltransferase PglX [Nitrososphaerota archaeon]